MIGENDPVLSAGVDELQKGAFLIQQSFPDLSASEAQIAAQTIFKALNEGGGTISANLILRYYKQSRPVAT